MSYLVLKMQKIHSGSFVHVYNEKLSEMKKKKKKKYKPKKKLL